MGWARDNRFLAGTLGVVLLGLLALYVFQSNYRQEDREPLPDIPSQIVEEPPVKDGLDLPPGLGKPNNINGPRMSPQGPTPADGQPSGTQSEPQQPDFEPSQPQPEPQPQPSPQPQPPPPTDPPNDTPGPRVDVPSLPELPLGLIKNFPDVARGNCPAK